MRYLLLFALLSTVSGCVAEVPVDGRYDARYSDRDYDTRPHDNGYHRGWYKDRHGDDDEHGHGHDDDDQDHYRNHH